MVCSPTPAGCDSAYGQGHWKAGGVVCVIPPSSGVEEGGAWGQSPLPPTMGG